MYRNRGQRALATITLVVSATMLLAACDDGASTPTTFRIFPVTTEVDPDSAAAAPSTTTSTAPTTSTTVASTTTSAPATTTTTKFVASAAPATTTTTSRTPTTVAAEPAPPASQGWITVLASLSTSNYTRAEAAAWRLELGIDSAELLLSNDYSSLTPGYWVLYRGPYPDRSTAAGVCNEYADLVPGCYPSPLTLAD